MGRTQPKSAAQLFHLTPELENQTLGAALRHWLPKLSWSQVRKVIESRRIMVSGNLCVDAGRRLKSDEVVKLLSQPTAAPPRPDDVKVQYLDAHVVVVEKPSGMTTNRHREEQQWAKRRRQIQPTLDELLPQIITQIEGRRGKRGVPPPVRAVHRIDRDTSGLVVFARTHAAERILAQQFRQHTTQRRYLAIVEGVAKAQTISSHLVRDRGDGRRGSTEESNVGKVAVTHVQPLEHPTLLPGECRGEKAAYTLIQCRLETGRTHQIRIHLSEQGHPVCGEKVYRQSKFGKISEDVSGAPRLALHAAELGFVHPVTGKRLRFQAALPPDLADFWRQLKRQTSAANERK
ncbi:MAG TPA: RluA family pseudouridine synthase [Pirellulales bacterium]|jgi:23S rRNA pseudouridine1911/1915/1917 synthase|nr:RluA family pseudouridine synthase [Pirellulales bacterium]